MIDKEKYIAIDFILEQLLERYSYIDIKTVVEILDIIFLWRNE